MIKREKQRERERKRERREEFCLPTEGCSCEFFIVNNKSIFSPYLRGNCCDLKMTDRLEKPPFDSLFLSETSITAKERNRENVNTRVETRSNTERIIKVALVQEREREREIKRVRGTIVG